MRPLDCVVVVCKTKYNKAVDRWGAIRETAPVGGGSSAVAGNDQRRVRFNLNRALVHITYAVFWIAELRSAMPLTRKFSN